MSVEDKDCVRVIYAEVAHLLDITRVSDKGTVFITKCGCEFGPELPTTVKTCAEHARVAQPPVCTICSERERGWVRPD